MEGYVVGELLPCPTPSWKKTFYQITGLCLDKNGQHCIINASWEMKWLTKSIILCRTLAKIQISEHKILYYLDLLFASVSIYLFYRCHPGSNQFQIPMEKNFPKKYIFCPMNKDKTRWERIFEIVHCPFKGWADMHDYIQPKGPGGRC